MVTASRPGPIGCTLDTHVLQTSTTTAVAVLRIEATLPECGTNTPTIRLRGELIKGGGVITRELIKEYFIQTYECRASVLAGLGDASHHRLKSGWLELSRGQVIKEEQRLGAVAEDVIDTHCHQVLTNSVVSSQCLSYLYVSVD